MVVCLTQQALTSEDLCLWRGLNMVTQWQKKGSWALVQVIKQGPLQYCQHPVDIFTYHGTEGSISRKLFVTTRSKYRKLRALLRSCILHNFKARSCGRITSSLLVCFAFLQAVLWFLHCKKGLTEIPGTSSLKGIVSWDWDWLEWIVNERSKELRMPEHIFIVFWCHLLVLTFLKQALPVSHLTVTLRMMSNNRRSVSSIIFVHVWSILQEVSYSPDEEIDRDITFRMIAAIFRVFFCDQNCTLRLLLLSASDHWSPMLICGCYSSFAE
jgi:hypothetical protein